MARPWFAVFAAVLSVLSTGASVSAQAPRLNEIVTSNGGGLVDENGDASDWVEIFHPGPGPLDLIGYGLSDDPNDPFRWVFTNTVLQPGEFLVVFCDGKDRQARTFASLNPVQLDGLKVWLDAAVVLTNDVGQVRAEAGGWYLRRWSNQVAGGDSAAQGASTSQPRWLAGDATAPARVRFDGADDVLSLAAVPAENNFCVTVVARASVPHEVDAQAYGVGGVSGQRYLFGANHGGDFYAGAGVSMGTNGVGVYEHGSGYMPALAVFGGPIGTGFQVLSVNYSNRQPFLYVQGHLASAGLVSARTRVNAPTDVGAGAYGAFAGEVAEVLIHARTLTDLEVHQVHQFLAHKYGLAVRRTPHANFSLDRDGEPLRLTGPDGTPSDELPAASIPRDVSYGRTPDGSGTFHYFVQPTPGASNTTPASTEFLERPIFSHEAGYWSNNFLLSLSTSNSGAVIRYTLDGSEPTETSPLYRDPLTITNRATAPNNLSLIPTVPGYQPPSAVVYKFAVVRAKAFKTGALPSETVSRSFIVEPAGPAKFSLPVVSLITDPRNFFDPDIGIYVPGNAPGGNYAQSGDAWERPVHLEMFEPDGRRVISQSSGIRIHGNTSFGFPIKALRLHPLNPPGHGPIRYQVFPDLPIEEFNRLLLRPSGHDFNLTLSRDGFMQSFGAELGLDVQAYRPALLFLNGEYWGIHNLQEAFEPGYFGSHHGVDPTAVDYLEGFATPVNGDTTAWDAMMAFLNTHDISQETNYVTLQSMMDPANFIDFKVCEIYYYRWDIGNHRLWRPRTPEGRFRWILFDCDVGWGGFWSVPPAYAFPMLAYDLESSGPWTQYQQNPGGNDHNNPVVTFLLRTLVNNPNFRRDFINRFADAMNWNFEPGRVLRRIDEFAARIAPEVPAHTQRWHAPGSPAAWSNQIQVLRDFAVRRPAYMRQHMTNAFRLPGLASVTLRVNDTNAGAIRVSTLTVSPPTNAPWTGAYFRNNPVTLKAAARPGYRFVRWTGLSDPSDTVTLAMLGNAALIANFVSVPNTNPPVPLPHDLREGPYAFTTWSATEPAGSFPPNMVFLTATNADPTLETEFTNWWTLPYDRTSRSRVNGLGEDGVAFLNTSDPQPEGGGYLGAALLALDTTGQTNVEVRFTAGTVAANARLYALRLQYRIGDAGPFLDVLGANGNPVEYSGGATGEVSIFGPVALPPAAAGAPLLQLRWKYHHLSGASGPRTQLRLDDIVVAPNVARGRPSFGSIQLNQAGLALRLTGAALQAYVIETSPDLVHWSLWRLVQAAADGRLEVSDPDRSVGSSRFYRIREP